MAVAIAAHERCRRDYPGSLESLSKIQTFTSYLCLTMTRRGSVRCFGKSTSTINDEDYGAIEKLERQTALRPIHYTPYTTGGGPDTGPYPSRNGHQQPLKSIKREGLEREARSCLDCRTGTKHGTGSRSGSAGKCAATIVRGQGSEGRRDDEVERDVGGVNHVSGEA